ncbi:MAG: protease inhibitor I42 family protein [Myxococcota bacterium]
MLRVLAPCLLASVTMGCTGDRPAAPPNEGPAPAADGATPAKAEGKADDAGKAAVPATGKTIDLSDLRGKPAPVIHPGDQLVVELAESSQGIHPKYRYGWGRAKVDGIAVRFVSRTTEGPPPEVDGGRSREHFEFRAAAPGRATITIPVAGRGDEADAEDFVIAVEVTPAAP